MLNTELLEGNMLAVTLRATLRKTRTSMCTEIGAGLSEDMVFLIPALPHDISIPLRIRYKRVYVLKGIHVISLYA